MDDIKRVSTGLKTLDDVLEGGLIKGDFYIITGGPGLGKTTLAMHYAIAGVEEGERTLYISLDEEPIKMARNMARVGFNLLKAKESGKFLFFKTDPYKIKSVLEKGNMIISDRVENFKPERIVFDSLTDFAVQFESESKIRSQIERLLYITHSWGEGDEKPTVLFTVDQTEDYSTQVEEFLVDGVIKLRRIQTGKEVNKTLQITKMRGTNFKPTLMLYNIKPGQGFNLQPNAPIMGL
ncbi:MAG: AAA family ATPase [Candidatus Altiarchaeales archaeon]|nr:AAA family ATPase [Candidatus Altiarchaeales archaeon]